MTDRVRDAMLDELSRLYGALRVLWREQLSSDEGTALPFDAWLETVHVRRDSWETPKSTAT